MEALLEGAIWNEPVWTMFNEMPPEQMMQGGMILQGIREQLAENEKKKWLPISLLDNLSFSINQLSGITSREYCERMHLLAVRLLPRLLATLHDAARTEEAIRLHIKEEGRLYLEMTDPVSEALRLTLFQEESDPKQITSGIAPLQWELYRQNLPPLPRMKTRRWQPRLDGKDKEPYELLRTVSLFRKIIQERNNRPDYFWGDDSHKLHPLIRKAGELGVYMEVRRYSGFPE